MANLPTGYVATGSAPKGVLSPNDAFAQAQLQRRLAIAQMLQQNAMDGSAYSSLNGMRVIPRMGLGPAAGQIASALLGGFEYKKAQKEQSDILNNQAARQSAQVDAVYGGGDASGSNPNLGLSKEAFAAWMRQDPGGAMKFAAEHSALTDQNRQYAQQGRNLNDVGQLDRAAQVVKGTQTFQPGTTNIVPGSPVPFVAADFGKGTTGGYDTQGNPVLNGMHGNGVLAQLAGQQQAATQANTIGQVTGPNGAQGPAWLGPVANANTAAIGGGASPGQPTTPADFAASKQQTMQKIMDHAALLQNQYGLSGDRAQKYIADQFNQNGIDPAQMGDIKPTNGTGATPPVSPIPMGPQSGFVGQSTMDKSLSEKRAGNIAEMEQDINDKAATAQSKLALNKKMVDLLSGTTMGPLADRITAGKNLLHSLGWSGPDPTNNQELEKYAMQAALENAKQTYGSRITNADLKTLPTWNPSASLTENAFKTIIENDNTRQGRLVQRQTAYNDFRNKGGDLNQFSSWFNQNYPEMGISASTDTTPGNGVTVAPSAAPSGNRMRWNPATGKLEPF